MRDNLQFQPQPFMLIALLQAKIEKFSMTDSMNFGPDWIRNLASEGTTGGGTGGGTRYQLADHRYGREEMLALFDKNLKPPPSLTNFKGLYSEITLPPLTLLPTSEEESNQRGWQARPIGLLGPPRGRGGSLERGGRITRGRGSYPSYSRSSGYDSGWGNGEQPDWSPRKEYQPRTGSGPMDNWRRSRNNEEDDGWRSVNCTGRGGHEKWGRQSSWRGDGDADDRPGGPSDRRSWHDGPPRRSWDGGEDRLPEWANEAPAEGGGSFDERGAFHGSDEEQVDRKSPVKRDGIQKSTSQQHITNKAHPPLPSSKSSTSLVNKGEDEESRDVKEEAKEKDHSNSPIMESEKSPTDPPIPEKPEEIIKNIIVEPIPKPNGRSESNNNLNNGPNAMSHRVEDSEFEKLQEDFVLKLVENEEPPKQQNMTPFDMTALQPPPNLAAPINDKWFYQDPQGQMQGPFNNIEMSEWYKAGYFTHQLKVRRQCDERYFLLGELITMCSGSNPFQSNARFPILRNDVTKMPNPDVIQFQYMSQMAAYKQAQARILAEPWSALTLQQQELAAQRLIVQQQQQVPQDLQYMQQQQTNPLMHMLTQMQQANKLPNAGVVEKPPQSLPGSLDPHMHVHMGNLLSMQNRLPNHLPSALPNPSIPPENHPNLQPMPGLGMNVPRPGSVDQLGDNDPIGSLIKHLHQQKQESLWQQSQFAAQNAPPHHQQWQTLVTNPPQETPISMWDLQQGAPSPKQQEVQAPSKPQQQPQPQAQPVVDKAPKVEKDAKAKEDPKEQKKKKEVDEKQAKKDVEEKRKQEQRKLEAEKRAAEERRKKEEDKIRKELEKAKRDAEEKRMRELEEKRRMKEQRKAEDEARRKQDEVKKQEEERMRRERDEREAEERQRAEEKRLEQIRLAKAAPWSQSNSTMGMSLAEIQKAEREKRAQEAALQLQRQQIEKEMQQQQQQQLQQQEKPGGMQLNWANKPIEPKKVKSLAEIQAEEQERLAKEAAEARHRKEKEAREQPQVQNVGSIWSNQNLSWVAPPGQSATHGATVGFWDDQPIGGRHQAPVRPVVTKSGSTGTVPVRQQQKQAVGKQQPAKQAQQPQSAKQAQQQQQPAKQAQQQQQPKKKREEKVNNNNNGPQVDDFTGWCYKTLGNISTNVDVPTFVAFLRDIESAMDVREYCKEYLGEGQATSQFAGQFLEKRRQCKPTRADLHKDDMCAPAPAINPNGAGADFQEVKGKNKKNKKSKMQKVDSRILGFNVTSAPDRINVGDRDYGDNS